METPQAAAWLMYFVCAARDIGLIVVTYSRSTMCRCLGVPAPGTRPPRLLAAHASPPRLLGRIMCSGWPQRPIPLSTAVASVGVYHPEDIPSTRGFGREQRHLRRAALVPENIASHDTPGVDPGRGGRHPVEYGWTGMMLLAAAG